MRLDAARRGSEEGLGLVEVMISIVLIGIVLMGLASSLISSLSAIRKAEKTSIATALHQELLEATLAIPWARIGLYTDDPDYQATVVEDGSADVHDTVGIAPYATWDSRIRHRIETVTREGSEYTVVTDIYWVNADHDPTDDEAKRIRTQITWDDASGGGSATFYAMRLPTALELEDEFAVLLFTSSPNTVQLDDAGLTTSAMTVIVNTSAAAQTPSVTTPDANGGTVTLGPWVPNGDATSWEATLPAGSGPFAAGDSLFLLSVDSVATPTETKDSALTVTFVGSGDPAPSDNFEIQNFTVTPNPATVDNQRDLCTPTYTVRVQGFTSADTVDIQYEYWTGSKSKGTTTYTKTQSSQIQATFSSQSGEVAIFQLVHPSVSDEEYLAGETITLTATATRAGETTSKSTTMDLPLTAVSGNCA